jgi:polyhydroxyalkanoate synthesis regulator phasin
MSEVERLKRQIADLQAQILSQDENRQHVIEILTDVLDGARNVTRAAKLREAITYLRKPAA